MKPYYEKDGIVIYHGDCLELLPRLQGDVVLTDPPYNAKTIGVHHKAYKGSAFPMTDEAYIRFCRDWYSAAAEHHDRLIFTSGIAHAWNYPAPAWVLAWHKPAAKGFNRMGGYNSWEPVLIYGKTPQRFTNDVYTLVPKNWSTGPEREHPCPKPIELWKWLAASGSKEGETLLDPFMGSGTTLVAAKALRRKAIGIEIEERYCEITAQRLAQEVLL